MILDTLRRTLLWFQKAVPAPTSKNFHTQLGCHVEEFGEMLQCLSTVDPLTQELLDAARLANECLADHLKAKDNVIFIEDEDDAEFLDSLCDQVVTAAGVAHMSQVDFAGAMDEVNRSNFSKFDPETGQPIHHPETRKVMKGPAYSPPELTPFLVPLVTLQ